MLGPSSPATLEKLVSVLAPYLGEHMARAAVRSHAEKLGLGSRPPDPEQLEDLLEQLHRGLAVFVGRPKAEAIMMLARAAMTTAGRGK